MGGLKDWELLEVILDGDWTLVTRNAYDFRGPATAPGTRGEYAKAELHAGLVCLNAPQEGFDLDQQLELFSAALDELDRDPDLVNQVLEVTLDKEGEDVVIRRYRLPDADK
jgi:hypothetical protein